VIQYRLEHRPEATEPSDVEEVFRRILEILHDLVVLYDRDGNELYPVRFRFMNDPVCRDIYISDRIRG